MMEKSIGVSPLGTVNTPGTYPDIYTVGCFTTSGAIAGASIAVLLCKARTTAGYENSLI